MFNKLQTTTQYLFKFPCRIQNRYFRLDGSTYEEIHRKSVSPSTRNAFWQNEAAKLHWHKKPTQILDLTKPNFPRWFVDGEINASFNCLDRHILEGRGEQTALIFDSPVTGTKSKLSFKDLHSSVEKFAGVLRDSCKVKKGDSVIIYMPMIPEAVIAMLACARIGAPHSVVFGGFASRELAIRIDDARAKAVVTATCGVEPNKVVNYEPLLKGALDMCKHKPEKIVMKYRAPTPKRPDLPPRSGEVTALDWDESLKSAQRVAAVPVKSTDPLYILYTSGSTGTPKGIVRDTGGYCTAMNFSMETFMRAGKGDVYFASSDVGWVVGHVSFSENFHAYW
jgi:propionyl-CoA synthetase